MTLHPELFMRVKAFMQSVANVCPSCPRRSDATCSVCVCHPARRLLNEIETEAATAKPDPVQQKKRPQAETLLLQFIRGHEKRGTLFTFTINRIRIAGVEGWIKQRAIQQLCAEGLLEVIKKVGSNMKHAQTVESRRAEIDKELSNATN